VGTDFERGPIIFIEGCFVFHDDVGAEALLVEVFPYPFGEVSEAGGGGYEVGEAIGKGDFLFRLGEAGGLPVGGLRCPM